MAVGKLHILWPHLDSDLFTKITIFLVRFFVLTVGYYEASEGQPVLGLTVLGPLLDNMFNYASAFNKRLVDWNTGKVTAMEGMFGSASMFNQPLAFDTSGVIYM